MKEAGSGANRSLAACIVENQWKYMMRNELPYDYARCLSSECLEFSDCLRSRCGGPADQLYSFGEFEPHRGKDCEWYIAVLK